MNEFVILMRLDLTTKEAQPSPEQLQEYMKQYHAWIDSIVAKKQFAGGTGLSTEGRVIKSKGIVTDGPFVEVKESLAGFIVVHAENLAAAAAIAERCPILNGDGNSVEVRQIVSVHDPK